MDFILHELLKNVNGPVELRYRESVIPPSDKEKSFIADVTRLFRRHQSGLVYGGFEEDRNVYRFSGLLKEYLASGDFYTFSTESAGHLVSIMGAIATATGGYYFAARCDDEGEDILLVFMLSQRTGHAVNRKTLTLESVLNLQMEHLDLAARISIRDWQDAKREPVSLVRGRKEVSDYFKQFIGLHEPRTNTVVTQRLRQFVDEWMDDDRFEPAQRETARARVLEYAATRVGQAVELKVIGTLVDPNRAEDFFQKANAVGLGAEFHFDRRVLKAWDRIVFEDPEIKLNLAKRQMNKRFIYSAAEKTLLVRDIVLKPEDLR